MLPPKKEGTTSKDLKTSAKTPSSKPETMSSNGCCKGTTTCSTAVTPMTPTKTSLIPPPAIQLGDSKKTKSKTRVLVKYDVGFNNSIYIRGHGANLSWDKGIVLKNLKNDEWVWETETPFTHCEFKVLINDKHYETGDNHHLNSGVNIQYTPKF